MIENTRSLEQRFGDLQTNINRTLLEEMNKVQQLQNQALSESKQTFTSQQQAQESHFNKLKIENMEGLQKVQAQVREQLSGAVGDIIKINKENFESLARTNNEKLSQIQGEIDKRLTENLQQNLKSFESVTKNLGQMQSTAQKMIDSTSSIEKLNSIFEKTNSKAFGSFGEQYLESMLSNHLHNKLWSKQVTVPGSNDKIDFVLNMGQRKIGIDSKFPVGKYQEYLEASVEYKKASYTNFLKAVKLMAQDISTKYNKDHFIDTLLMYLPSDGMYVEVVNDHDIMEYLRAKKVVPVSPTTIFPIITVIESYERNKDISENAEYIIQGLQVMKKSIDGFREEFRKLGDKIRQAQQNYDQADKNLIGVHNTVLKLEYRQDAPNEALDKQPTIL